MSKKSFFLLILLLSTSMNFQANANPTNSFGLFPEDGSQTIRKWYYSEKELPYMYQGNEWNEVLQAFEKEGIQTINTKIGSFFQDLALFDKKGNLLVQHFPEHYTADEYDYTQYFSGFTNEIFERTEYGQDPIVHLLQADDLSSFRVQTRELTNTFIEGGASISGTFKNGDDYLLVNHSAFLGMKYYFKDRFSKEITNDEIKLKVEKDLHLKPGNFIVLTGTSHIHLDTFIKALPNGVMLIDAPDKKIPLLKSLYKKTRNPEYLNYLALEQKDQISFEIKAIQKAKNQLSKRFRVIEIPGVFSRTTRYNNNSWKTTDINFFNGVSGTNKNGKQFFITNRASDTPELEDYWRNQLIQLGFSSNNFHFVGKYKGSAGLDCMGSSSP
jgi:hypothetical protein